MITRDLSDRIVRRDTVATWLNNFENHRTQIEYEDSMIFKQFVFQFINYYFLLLYIAFLKVGAPFAPCN